MDRLEVAARLREIAHLIRIGGGDRFRARAYEGGARALETLPEDLAAVAREGRLTKVPGIGPALARTIRELLETGQSRVLAELRGALPPGAMELAQVLSVPRMVALHETLGITTLAELEAACVAGRVRTVKGFGAKTEGRIREAIAALSRPGDEVHLHEAMAAAEGVLAYVRAHPAVDAAEAAGDLRRRTETVTRVDLVVASRDPGAVVEHVCRHPLVASVLERGSADARIRLAGGLDLEIVIVGSAAYPWALHRATGSAGHVARLDERAGALGLRAGPAGLSRAGRALPVRREADVYRHLGLAWVPPELREDAGEVEAAAAGELEPHLVRREDVQGLVHCHTVYSDGRHTVEQMARGAEARGMRYLTITDHSASAFYAGGLSIDRLERQWEEIARVQETVEIRILRGTECDILRDGALDYPDSVLDRLDVVIASVHQRYRMTSAQMTARLEAAMRHPRFKIWGHALGRYLLSRPPIDCDVERILAAAAESRAAIEINGDPYRLDMEPRWIRAARRRGLRFVISSDAHSVAALDNVRWGVDMARRGWLRADEVLNTLGPAEFQAAVRP
jgi:DNA polymerase (family 10)